MKTYIKIWWKQIVVLSACLIIGLLLLGDSCRTNKTHKVVASNTIKLAEQRVIDSLNTMYINRDIAREDSLEYEKRQDIAVNQATAEYYRLKYIKTDKSYQALKKKADSLSKKDTGQCREIIDAYVEVIDTLNSKNENLTSVCTELEKEAQSWCELSESLERKCSAKDSLLFVKQTTINTQEEVIKDYDKRLKKSTNWWARNTKWVIGGAGFLLGISLATK